MNVLKAKVVGGRLVGSAPADLPEGTEVEMLAVPAHRFPEGNFTDEELTLIAWRELALVDPEAVSAWMRGQGPDPWPNVDRGGAETAARNQAMKYNDPIIDELRKIRENLGRRYGFDARRIAEALQAKEGEHGHPLVSRPARRVARGERT